MAGSRYNPSPRLPLGTPSKRNPNNVVTGYHGGQNCYGSAKFHGTTPREIRENHTVMVIVIMVTFALFGVVLVAMGGGAREKGSPHLYRAISTDGGISYQPRN